MYYAWHFPDGMIHKWQLPIILASSYGVIGLVRVMVGQWDLGVLSSLCTFMIWWSNSGLE